MSGVSHGEGTPIGRTTRPPSVTLAAWLQLLFAAVFVIAPIVLILYGSAGQAAAERAVAREGFSPDVLAQHDISFNEGASLLIIPFAMTFLSAALGFLNLSGKRVGWVVPLVYEPLLLIIGGQIFATRLLERAFKNSGDTTLVHLDAKAIAVAVTKAWTAWFYPYTTYARFALATLGSLLVIVLLLTHQQEHTSARSRRYRDTRWRLELERASLPSDQPLLFDRVGTAPDRSTPCEGKQKPKMETGSLTI